MQPYLCKLQRHNLQQARIYQNGSLPFRSPGLRQNQPQREEQARREYHPQDHVFKFSTIFSRKRNPPFTPNERPTKKQRVRSNRSINNIEVAASDTFKVSDETTEELHTNKRGIVGTTIESAL
jgi:hypothetical protein